MAWELQSQMVPYIEPSIMATAEESGELMGEWLASRYADQRWEEGTGQAAYDALRTEALALPHETVVGALAVLAVKYATTTNGAHEFYLDSGGYHTIAWCTEDEMHGWYA